MGPPKADSPQASCMQLVSLPDNVYFAGAISTWAQQATVQEWCATAASFCGQQHPTVRQAITKA